MSTLPPTAAAAPIPSGRTPLQIALALVILLSGVLHGVAVLKAPPLQSANDRSRWCTIRSLIEDRTYRIDTVRQEPGWDTIDLIRRDGHFYSTKPPLMATWVAGVTELILRATGWTFRGNLQEIHATTLLWINVLPFVLGLCGLSWWLQRQPWQPWTQLFVLTTAAFGTLVSPFLASLNNHTPAAMGVLVAVICWQWPLTGSFGRDLLRFAVWGFAASWAACHDLPAAALTLTMLGFALVQRPGLALAGFLPGAALPAAAFLLCNWWALDSFFPAYSGYGGETYRFLHEGVPSYWLRPQGIDRNLDSFWSYLFHCTIGHHGWWLLTPVWGLVVIVPLFATRSLWTRERQMLAVTLVLSVIVLGFYLSRTGNYNYGGVSCGLRWAIFLTPLWLVALAMSCDRLPTTRLFRAGQYVVLGISIFSAWSPMSRPWQQPWSFQLAQMWGYIPGSEPPAPWDRPHYSWFSTLPEPVSEGESVWVEFERQEPTGRNERMRLALIGEQQIGQRPCAVLEITWRTDGKVTDSREILIDRQAFASGRPSAECVFWKTPGVSTEQKQADLAWFRGLPLLKAYRPGYERYLKTALRRDALVCQRTAAQVDHATNDAEPPWRYRSDVWLSPEVPFGAARVDWTVLNPLDGEVRQRSRWEVVACEPKVSPSTPVTVEMFDHSEPIVPQVRKLLKSREN